MGITPVLRCSELVGCLLFWGLKSECQTVPKQGVQAHTVRGMNTLESCVVMNLVVMNLVICLKRLRMANPVLLEFLLENGLCALIYLPFPKILT